MGDGGQGEGWDGEYRKITVDKKMRWRGRKEGEGRRRGDEGRLVEGLKITVDKKD